MFTPRGPSEYADESSKKSKKARIIIASSIFGAGLTALGIIGRNYFIHDDWKAMLHSTITESADNTSRRPSLDETIQADANSVIKYRVRGRVSAILEGAEYSRVVRQLGFNEDSQTVQLYKDAKANNNTEEILRFKALLDNEMPFFTEGWAEPWGYIGLHVYHGSQQIALLNRLDITNNTLEVNLYCDGDPLIVSPMRGIFLGRIGEVIQEWDILLNRYYLEKETIKQQYSNSGHEAELIVALRALNNRFIEFIEQFLIRYSRPDE